MASIVAISSIIARLRGRDGCEAGGWAGMSGRSAGHHWRPPLVVVSAAEAVPVPEGHGRLDAGRRAAVDEPRLPGCTAAKVSFGPDEGPRLRPGGRAVHRA